MPNQPSPPSPEPHAPQLDSAVKVLTRFQRFAWDIAGMVALAISLMTLLSLAMPQITGGLLDLWANFLSLWFD